MNTFGALKYLEAEQTVVEEIMLNLKDQLNKLKIEELAIRASIRSRMKETQANAADLNDLLDPNQSMGGELPAIASNPASQPMNTLPSTSAAGTKFDGGGAATQGTNQNRPIEVSINEALEMISRYRERDPLTHPGDEVLGPLEQGPGEFDEQELDDAEMDEGTGFDEPSARTHNPDLEFLDLRNAEPGDDDPE